EIFVVAPDEPDRTGQVLADETQLLGARASRAEHQAEVQLGRVGRKIGIAGRIDLVQVREGAEVADLHHEVEPAAELLLPGQEGREGEEDASMDVADESDEHAAPSSPRRGLSLL